MNTTARITVNEATEILRINGPAKFFGIMLEPTETNPPRIGTMEFHLEPDGLLMYRAAFNTLNGLGGWDEFDGPRLAGPPPYAGPVLVKEGQALSLKVDVPGGPIELKFTAVAG